ncbi:MAG: TlpA family protein disulfide reductase [Proteobacteria bacterium]|nr:TlpA family protein disulfide reductase [Pseudomonadota bacterium]
MIASRPLRSLLFLALCCLPLWSAKADAAAESTTLKGKAGTSNGLIALGAEPIPFTLQDLEGNAVSLGDFKGKKAVLLAFWSFFCGPCREEIPLLDEIVKKYADQGVEMLAINLDGPKLEKAVQKYVAGGNFGFRVLWEEMEGIQYKTADAYGVAGTPSVVLVGKNGKVSWTHVGREEGPTIEKEIQKALK